MIQKDSVLNQDLNSTQTSVSPAHAHLLSDTPDAIKTNKTESERLDRLGMESARRAQNRVHNNEQRLPEDTIFTK
jgi:hypothetical protein